MKSVKVKKIIAMVAFLAICLTTFAVGVTALAKSMQFSLGTRYDPAVKVKVEMEIDGQYETIFNSANQGEVNYNASYIDSVTKDTIFIKQDATIINNNAINFKFYSYDTTYKINIYINGDINATTLNKASGENSPTETGVISVDVSENNTLLGLILVSLKFEAVEEYTVSFNTQGGSACENITFEKGQTPALPTPTLTGYEFLGWFTSADYTNQITSTTQITASTTLYAKWNVETYTITYKDQGGADFSGTHASGYPTVHVYETQTNLLSPTKANHTFQGWFLDSDCTGSAITALGATAFTDDITLYAKWKVNCDYLVTFSSSDSSVTTSSALEMFLNRDFSLNVQASASGATAFVFDIILKNSAQERLYKIVDYNWIKTSTSNNYGTITIPSSVLTSVLTDEVESVEISAHAGTPWNNTSTTISTSGTVSISTSQQLAGLATQNNGGTKYSGVTLNLTNNIYLNDEIFLNLGNGYVKVTDGVNVAYLGDGAGRIIDGTYTTLTTAGQWYSNTSGTTGSYAGTLNSWTPISKSYHYSFEGTFNGGNYEISGMYINTTSNYQGLFGYTDGASIQNVGVVNGYVKGGSDVGGICGDAGATTITNCTNSGTITGTKAGGICGDAVSSSTVTRCTNFGTVSGLEEVGGICGYLLASSTVTRCTNFGTVSGLEEVGGIYGYCDSGAVSDCNNYGNVYGNTSVGGITGYASWSSVKNCNNTGIVVGVDEVSGICGHILVQAPESSVLTSYIINCSTTNTYTGSTHVGKLYGYYEYNAPGGSN